MRKSLVVFSFLFSFLPLAHGEKKPAAKPDPSRFPVHVHISGSHQLASCNGSRDLIGCTPSLFVEAVIDGKKVELWGEAAIEKRYGVLIPGDYLAQASKDPSDLDKEVISRTYVLLLSDGSTWPCRLSGISE